MLVSTRRMDYVKFGQVEVMLQHYKQHRGVGADSSDTTYNIVQDRTLTPNF